MLRYVDQGDASAVKEMRQRRDASTQDIKSAQEYRRYTMPWPLRTRKLPGFSSRLEQIHSWRMILADRQSNLQRAR
jgi:hypothetical protein